ncbi:hypothetical protein F4813DRAFT_240868 [Daldinia decipiens]|uniref:uncharacterized protein n=1 Tax=Daldinia decipiens TaxID=326647 RepID=UPI0020C4F3AA|nr:uncharacterized protein F4813DRAFT_240868 [Daldinia decipiens]KAI1653830.1 hypothetical protein F4813DRAFT_240868 [Daldinia decipiens]
MKPYLLGCFCLMATGLRVDLTVAPLIIEGVVDSDGIKKTFNGTIQEIDMQIRNLNPDFSWEHFQSMTRRQDKPPRKRITEKVLCHVQNLPPASRVAIEKSRDWLNSLATGLSVDAQRCTKFSCMENAAVWFCNDNLWWIQQNSITLADHINDILDEPDCAISGNDNLIQGQAFDGGDYNIIVNADQCP